MWSFDNQESATEFALNFSNENNIVKSKEWANMCIEDALHRAGNRGYTTSKETREKLSIAHKGKNVSQETREKISKSLTGVKKSNTENIKIAANRPERIEQAKKNLPLPKYGEDNPFYGKKHTPEMIKYYSESQKGLSYEERYGIDKAKIMKYKNGNAARGKKWWTNGIEDKISVLCPGNNFILGRSCFKK